jgi:hypothetical protein
MNLYPSLKKNDFTNSNNDLLFIKKKWGFFFSWNSCYDLFQRVFFFAGTLKWQELKQIDINVQYIHYISLYLFILMDQVTIHLKRPCTCGEFEWSL